MSRFNVVKKVNQNGTEGLRCEWRRSFCKRRIKVCSGSDGTTRIKKEKRTRVVRDKERFLG